MEPRTTIRVFEHERLEVDRRYACGPEETVAFTWVHYNALAGFNDAHGARFFTLGRRSVKATNYVGFVQIGRLGVEILPKADRGPGDENQWHSALVKMLLATRKLATHTPERAFLASERADLLSVFVDAYLTGVERLMHEGLTRRYRTIRSNATAYRGRLLVAENVRRNLVHAERCFVEHQAYDHTHLLHRILRQALEALARADLGPGLGARVRRALTIFPPQAPRPVSARELDGVVFDRNTERYRDAHTLARLILRHASPSVRGGAEQVLALLFDMNELFEEFVGRQLQRLRIPGVTVRLQHSKPFWPEAGRSRTTLRPDVVVTHRDGPTVVLDCKWKVPDRGRPSVADLRQIFAYNQYFASHEGVLLYPASGAPRPAETAGAYVGRTHGCRVAYLSLFRDGRFDLPWIRDQLRRLAERRLPIPGGVQ